MTLGHARDSRANPTLPESRLWEQLRNRQLGGFKFRRQHKTEGLRPDFFCPVVGLAIELDGHTHDVHDDAARDAALKVRGILVLRFSNVDVMESLEGVCGRILEVSRSLPPRVHGRDKVRW